MSRGFRSFLLSLSLALFIGPFCYFGGNSFIALLGHDRIDYSTGLLDIFLFYKAILFSYIAFFVFLILFSYIGFD